MRKLKTIFAILSLILVSQAWAGDGATVIFKSGQVVQIDDGYRQIVESMKTLNGASTDHKILELTIGGSSFLLNISEVVIVCRDNCSNVVILHQLDPKRGGTKAKVVVEEPRNNPAR